MKFSTVVNLLDLPEDQLEKIFNYFDFTSRFRMELVCKRCMKIMRKVWSDELIIVINEDSASKKWDRIFFYERPSLLDWNQLCKSIWNPIVEKCENLMSIEFSTNFVLNKKDVQTIVDRCPKLYEIKLLSIMLTVDTIYPLSQLKYLHSLEFGETNIWNLNIDFDLWTLMASDSHNCFSFDSCEQSILPQMTTAASWHVPNAKKLCNVLSHCFQSWIHLRKLQINVFKMSSEVLESFIYLNENLRNIKLIDVKSIEHKNVLGKFFKTRNFLLKLSLEFVSFGDQTEQRLCEEEILKIITDHCLLIRSIDISYYGYYGHFPKSINFRKISKLKHLSVRKGHFDDSLNFLQTSTNLEFLTLIGIIDDSVDKIWQREWGLTKLKYLDVKIDRKYFTIDDVIEILSINLKMSSIQIPLIAVPNEQDVKEMANSCQSLTKLILSNFYNSLSDQKVFEIFVENLFRSNNGRNSNLPLLVKTTKKLSVPIHLRNLPIFIEILP